MAIERRHRNPGQRPDIVEVDFGGQQINECLVRLRIGHRHDQLALVRRRLAETRCAGIGVARNTKGILMPRNGGDAGEEWRTNGQQITGGFQPLRLGIMLAIDEHAVAAHRQRRALLVDELANAGLAAFGVNHGFGEQLRFTLQPGRHAVGPAGTDGFDGALARRSASGPFELAQDALDEIIAKRVIEIDMRRLLPRRLGGLLALTPGAAEHAIVTMANEFTHCGMGKAERIIGAGCQRFDETDVERGIAIDAAATKDQLKRVEQPFRPALFRQQTRQTLGAAIAGQQAETDFGLTEARMAFGDAPMAGKREFHAAAERDALDGGDARLAHAFDLGECELGVVGQHPRFFDGVDFIEELANVGTSNEARRSVTGEHHRHHIVTPRQMLDNDDEFIDGAFVERVDRRVGDEHRRHLLAGCHIIVLNAEIAIAIEDLLVFGHRLAALPVPDRLAQFIKAFRVAQRRHVADIGAFDDRADHAAHVFAAARLGKLADFDEITRHRHGALFLADEIGQAAEIVAAEGLPRR